MVAKSSTSNRSVCWNVVFGARAEVPDGGSSPGSMLTDSSSSPVPLLSTFLLCSLGVLISFSSLDFRLINHAKVTSLSPLYTGNVSVQSQKCLCVTQLHHKNGQALFERWEQLFTRVGNRNVTDCLWRTMERKRTIRKVSISSISSTGGLNYFPPSSPGLFLHIEALFKMAEVGTGPERKQAQPKDQKRRSEGNSKEERRENGVGSGLAGSRRAQASLRPRHPLLIRGKVFPIGSFRPFSRSGVPLPSSPLRF
jgi:hypothetical protein